MPTWRKRLLENVLGEDGWDDPESIDLDGDAGHVDTFVAAAYALRSELKSGSVEIASASSVVALANLKDKPWLRYLDPSLSTTPQRGPNRLVLWRDPEHAIELSGRGTEWNISSGAIESLLLERDGLPDSRYEEQFEMDVGDAEESVDRRIAELREALKATQVERNNAVKTVAVRDREIDSLEKELNRAAGRADKESAKRLDIAERSKTLSERSAKLKEDLARARTELTDARTAAKTRQRELASVTSRLGTSEVQIEKANAKAYRDKQAVALLERRRDEAKQRIDALTVELESAERERVARSDERDEFAVTVSNLVEESERVQADLSAQLDRVHVLEEQVEALNQIVAERDQGLERSNVVMQERQRALDELTQHHRAATDESTIRQRELMALHTELGLVLPRRYLKRLGLFRRDSAAD
ncbi:hypothetical protein [Gemmatimonas sp.]|uniref:hypothetical protein n=1 Tax=Gemmatimonas sp. TaxID=1962908 RepID=UPI003564D44E